jgi:hypothetical protein
VPIGNERGPEHRIDGDEMRKECLVLCLLLGPVMPATAQVSVGVSVPGFSIGINLPAYPTLNPVPGYPVYYAPQLNSNFFFYDGMYWVYAQNGWYASTWYNGPWWQVGPEAVPLYVLRVPVRYYRQAPPYFRGWRADAPPRWGEHWGPEREQRRPGWDQWNRSAVPAPAPLPAYQRQYSGARYPAAEQQSVLQSQNYRHRPQDPVVQQHYQAQRAQVAPSNQAAPQSGRSPQDQTRGAGSASMPRQGAPKSAPGQDQHMGGGNRAMPVAAPATEQQRASPAQRQQDPRQSAAPRHEPQASRPESQDKESPGKGAGQESRQQQDPGRDKGEEHGGGSKK